MTSLSLHIAQGRAERGADQKEAISTVEASILPGKGSEAWESQK